MIAIPANIFASIAPFVGNSCNEIDNVHVMVSPEKSYIEAVNGHAFCRHALDNTDTSEEKHILIAPTKELVKACKAKGAETLVIMEDLSVRVIDSRGSVSYIHPANAKNLRSWTVPRYEPFYCQGKQSAGKLFRRRANFPALPHV